MSGEKYPGTYRALVANANDPLERQRVTLLIPQILGVTESAWAMPSTPTNIIPAPGDVVWVTFDAGDITAPIYTARGLLEISQQMADWVTGGGDVKTAPPAAGTPGVVGVLGGIKISWDGLDTNRKPMPAYFHHMRVERDTVNTFPNPVAVASFTSAQTYYDSGVGYTVPYFYRLVPISKTNVAGTPTPSSPGVKALTAGVLDIGANSVTANAIATGTFTATSGVIESLNSDVITGGTIDLTKGITIRSGTGVARMTITTAGLNTWDANNVNTVSLSNTGSAKFTGTISGSTITGSNVNGSTVRATGTGDVSLSSATHGLQVGLTTGLNIAMDNNEIQGRLNGGPSALNLNISGGNTHLGMSGDPGVNYSHSRTVLDDNQNRDTFYINTNFDQGFNQSSIRVVCVEETNPSVFNILKATIANNNVPNNVYRLRGDGSAYADGPWNSSGADFAEYFESEDGEPIPFGRGVALLPDGKVRPAQAGDFLLGITSAAPTIVGNSPTNWPSMYLRDVYGAYVLDEDGQRQVDPAFDLDRADQYATRDLRPEWNAIGLLGRVVADDDGTTQVGKHAAISSDGTFTASDHGFRCVQRVDDSHVLLLVTPQ